MKSSFEVRDGGAKTPREFSSPTAQKHAKQKDVLFLHRRCRNLVIFLHNFHTPLLVIFLMFINQSRVILKSTVYVMVLMLVLMEVTIQ